MAYAPHQRYGPPQGHSQPSRGAPPQNAPGDYQYDDRGDYQGQSYQNGNSYDDGSYSEPAPVAYRGKARYVENTPATRNHEEYGGFEEQGNPYNQPSGYNQGEYDQGGWNGNGYQNDQSQHAGHGYQQSSQTPPNGRGGNGPTPPNGGYHQQRPPPQRPGHAAASQPDPRYQSPGRSNDRTPPSRQYSDGPRPNTSGPSIARDQAPPRGDSQRPPPPSSGSHGQYDQGDRNRRAQPKSPQEMAWDNPFGSFGNVAAPKQEKREHRPPDQQRPSTAHSSSSHYHADRKSGESSRSHNRPPRQPSQDHYPLPTRPIYGQQDANQAPNHSMSHSQTQSRHGEYGDQGYPGSGRNQPQQNPRGAAPNFSRVQSPPIRNGQAQAQAPPPPALERSHTMPTELPLRSIHSSTPTSAFQSDLPFREGRAQTPVFANPQYAEAQSAVIESVSDPPTANADWPDAYHEPENSGHASQDYNAPPSHGQNQGAGASGGGGGGGGGGYNDFFDDYYQGQQDDSPYTHNPHNTNNGPHESDELDMPNFAAEKGHDELHLDSGTPKPMPMRTAYNTNPASPPHASSHQNHGFDFGVGIQNQSYGAQYDGYASQEGQPQQAPGPHQLPQQGNPAYQGGRGMPPPRGAPRGRGGYPPGPGRGGPPNPQDRSMSAGPGPRPNGAPYGPPPPNGRGGPPMRGRGGFGGPNGQGPAPAQGPGTPGPGAPGPMGGRGGPMGGRGRGMPPGAGTSPGGPGGPGRGAPPAMDGGSGPPAPMRPGAMQQNNAAARPPPVRNYNSTPSQAPPPNQSAPPAAAGAEGPVTMGELQNLKMVVADNPGDQESTLILVKKLVEASTVLVAEGGGDPKQKAKARERYVNDAYKLLKKLVSYNNTAAMFYMAECYGQGQLGLLRDPKEAFLLYQSAAKLGHAPSAYRVAVCCELGENEGGGTKRDPLKAMQWYRRAATLGDVPAMYKIGVILLKGLLGQNPQVGEAVNWLQRAADRADPDNPHALHELGLLYENPPAQAANSIFPDQNYSYELFTQAANLGYKFSQFRLGQCFEYGQLGCPIDPRQSIGWYSKAAIQEEHQSELALSGWYLTGSEGIISQSDTEAYLWARKAAQAGLAKAEYAMGYFTETGIGCSANLEDAKRWYWRASAQNFPKARERLEDLRRGGARAAQTRVSRSAMQKNQGDCKVM